MAWTFRNSTFAIGSGTGTRPTGTVDGDLLVACLMFAPGSGTVTPPSGWTSCGAVQRNASGDWGIQAFYAAALTGQSYAFSVSVGTDCFVGAWGGGRTTTPVDGYAGANVTGAANPAAPSVTPGGGAADDLLLCLVVDNAVTYAAPSGMTLRLGASGNDGNAVAELALASSGATGTKTFTSASATYALISVLFLTPAAAGPFPPWPPVQRIIVY